MQALEFPLSNDFFCVTKLDSTRDNTSHGRKGGFKKIHRERNTLPKVLEEISTSKTKKLQCLCLRFVESSGVSVQTARPVSTLMVP